MRRAILIVAALGCGEGKTIVNQPPIAIPGVDRVVRPNETVNLDASGSYDPDGTIVSYRWDFADGTSAAEAKVSHAWSAEGLYAVTLTVKDDRGTEAAAALKVTVSASGLPPMNAPPLAVIDGPSRGRPGETLRFSAARSTDPDGTVRGFAWAFGDGGTATGSAAAHAYANNGSYTVSLVVTDDLAASGRATLNVVIGTVSMNQPPIASAGNDVRTTIGNELSFDASASVDPDGRIVRYTWTFGDGAFADTPRATHRYNAPGTFTVTLSVEDDQGASAQDQLTVTVERPPSYDGRWILNPSVGAHVCMNSRRTYQIPFPAAQLDLTGSDANALVAAVVGGALRLSGPLDRTKTPPEAQLSWSGTETDATCGNGTVQHQLNPRFTDGASMAGRYTVLYNWSVAFCNCAKSFDFTGGKQ